jgi:hypothetical protein
MNITFACPACHRTTRRELSDATRELICDHCQARITVPPDAIRAGQLQRCIVCPSTELYIRKDFSQRLGVGMVVLGAVASSIAWYYHQVLATFAILFTAAGVDFILYLVTGNLLQCYRCHAEYRGVAGVDQYAPFSLETHERFRQQAARLAESELAGSPRRAAERS